jgi:putative exosortase-associated protein (TIGR04073 family)
MSERRNHRSSMTRTLLLGAAAAFLVAMTPTSADAGRGPLYGLTYPSKIGGKLIRGIGNVAFCWVEIPLEINEEIQNTDPLSGTFVGLGEGIFYTGKRAVLGVVDVVTFPIDVYGNNYQSIQRSEFPFIDEVF